MDLFTEHAARIERSALAHQATVAERVGVHVDAARIVRHRWSWRQRFAGARRARPANAATPRPSTSSAGLVTTVR